MSFDTIVRGGLVVTEEGARVADVGTRGETIAAVGPNLEAAGARVVEAEGHIVLPGIIDAHVHLELPVMGTVTSDDFRTGTRAGARGGVTTLIDFATPEDGESLARAVERRLEQAGNKSLVDYSLHVCVTRWEEQKGEIRPLIERGFPTFKEFMVYGSRGWESDDAVISATLEVLRDSGGMLLVHAESSKMLEELIARHHTPELMERHGARLHAMTRPPAVEIEAIRRAIGCSEATGGRLYIVHISTGEGAERVGEARARGVPLFGETCPQYLALDDSVFGRPDGHLFASCPQIKTKEDGERLWRALRSGSLSVVATDTCTFTRVQKDRWEGDWTRIPTGLPGLETLLPIVYTKGVLDGRLNIEQMADRLSTSPAKIMGLHPRKGTIRPGSDADLAIIHPERTLPVDPAKMETNVDWSPYEGWELAGFARTTLSRGEVIVEDYRVIGREGRGRFLPRRLDTTPT
ncbi:MAG: dihydropyrimidinase [Candidatus Eisenbacteria bacterium]